MITKGDDYPIHQLPVPISEVGTERNFYDRYFFNGYNKDGSILFAIAFSVYPNLNIKDGSFVLITKGKQHNFRYSSFLNEERLDISVGAMSIQIIEPLQTIGVNIDDNEKKLKVSIKFTSRFDPVQEPRITTKNGPRTMMDSTRLTQHGSWEGKIMFQDESVEISSMEFSGTRDRSWGIRPIGAADTQIIPSTNEPQFYWLWAPANYEEFSSHFYFVDDGNGDSSNSHAVIQSKKTELIKLKDLSKVISVRKGTRRIEKLKFLSSFDKKEVIITIKPKFHFYMCGLGYMHPEWGHGHFKGESASSYDVYDLSKDLHDPPFLHIQAFSEFELEFLGKLHKGIGVLEQLFLGPHKPSGFKELLDRPA